MSLLRAWMRGHGLECGTCTLPGLAVAKKQGDPILTEMEVVSCQVLANLGAVGGIHQPEFCAGTQA